MKLDIDDSEAFVNALLNPNQPNQALKTAALRYKKVMRDGTDIASSCIGIMSSRH